jgi:peptidyl-prolyl cis-trans isomerase SurA
VVKQQQTKFPEERKMSRLRLPLVLLISLISMTAVSHAAVLLDRVVAVVNEEVITWSELYKAMESDASPQVKELKEDERRKIYKENESAFLESLIDIRLQLQEAKNVGITVGEEEVKDAIENIKKKYSMTDDMFKDSLKKEGFTLSEYKKKLRDQILISKVVNQQVRSKILLSDEDVKKFIRDNEGNSDGYRISQIFLTKPQNQADGKKVEEKAAEILKKLHEGENFRDLARTYSEDPSASDGGDLGFIRKDQLLKEFAAAIAPLKVGQVSTPFWTERGLHIIKLDEKRDTKNQSEMKEEAEKELTDKIFSQRYHAWVKSLREKAFIEIRL